MIGLRHPDVVQQVADDLVAAGGDPHRLALRDEVQDHAPADPRLATAGRSLDGQARPVELLHEPPRRITGRLTFGTQRLAVGMSHDARRAPHDEVTRRAVLAVTLDAVLHHGRADVQQPLFLCLAGHDGRGHERSRVLDLPSTREAQHDLAAVEVSLDDGQLLHRRRVSGRLAHVEVLLRESVAIGPCGLILHADAAPVRPVARAPRSALLRSSPAG